MSDLNLKKLTFGTILVIGILLRISFISSNLWLDELATSWIVRDDYSDITERAAYNNLSPLYFVMVYASKLLFGYSEIALRIPGFLAGILVMILTYDAAKYIAKSHLVGIVAMFYCAIDPSLVQYSYELRPYIFNVLFSLIIIKLYYKIIFHKISQRYSLLLGVLTGIGFHFHYVSILICLPIGVIYFLFFLRKDARDYYYLRCLHLYVFGCLILVVPMFDHILVIHEHRVILGSFITINSITDFLSNALNPFIYGGVPFSLLIICIVRKDFFATQLMQNRVFQVMASFWIFGLILHIVAHYVFSINIFFSRYMMYFLFSSILTTSFILIRLKSKVLKMIVISFTLIPQFVSPKSVLHKRLLSDRLEEGMLNSFGNTDFKSQVSEIERIDRKYGFDKIYYKPELVERAIISIDSRPLLNDYLLSSLNSMYRLPEDILVKIVPIKNFNIHVDAKENALFIGKRIGPINNEGFEVISRLGKYTYFIVAD